MLTIRIIPKIRESPPARRKKRAVGDTVEVWVTQNSMIYFRFEKLKRWATLCYHRPLFLST